MKTIVIVTLIVYLTQFVLFSGAVPVGKRQAALPPIIASRVAPPADVPESAANVESKAIEANGDLPAGTEEVGGMALESQAPPSLANSTITKRDSVYPASPEEISELTFATILAANSYCRTVIPLGIWICPHCGDAKNLVLVKTFTTLVYDTNAMVLRDDAKKIIYVVFRGSNSIRNFVTDLIFVYKSYPPVSGTNVHTGFYDGYIEVQSQIVPVVLGQLTANPSYKIIVTGHSLGGAYAVLHALDLYQRDIRITPDTLQIITQGQPRVGDPAFASYAASTNLRLRRVVHDRDIVPHLPPGVFGFLHSGAEYWITDSGEVQVCDSTFETDSCGNSIVPFTSLTDHLTYFGINTGLCL